MVDWSNLPEDLLNFIASKLFSNVELKRFRSICTSWRRSSVSGAGNNNLVSSRRPLIIDPFLNTIFKLGYNNEVLSRFYRDVFLSRAAFFRVTHSSSSKSKGWLIKSDADVNTKTFHLLDPFTRLPLQHSFESKSLDLLKFTVSEILDAYAVLVSVKGGRTATEFKRVVIAKANEKYFAHGVVLLGISWTGDIYCWECEGKYWSRIDVTDDNRFTDMIVHNGLTYALDSCGVVWLISCYLMVSRYDTSFDKTVTNGYCIEKTFVECCQELYIVERFFEEAYYTEDILFIYVEAHAVKKRRKTVGFKVYKMDDELEKWLEVKSLGDNAIVMANDTCLSVLAHEFYGCLKNSVYFTDNEEKEMKVFKLDDNGGNGSSSSITTMSDLYQSCFQMFFPSFL